LAFLRVDLAFFAYDYLVTAGSSRINRLLFADDLVLPASFEEGL